MCVCAPFACLAHEGSEEGTGPPATAVIDVCVPPAGC